MGRVHPRPRAARGEGDERPAEDLAALQDCPALGRQEAEARSRREGLREGPRARAEQPARRRGAHPDLHGPEQREGARQRHRGEARPRAGPERQARPLPRGRRASTRARSRIPQKAFDRYLSAFELFPGDAQHERRSRARRQGDRAMGRGGRVVQQAIASADDERRARGRDHAAPPPRARPRRELQKIDEALGRLSRGLRGRRREHRGHRRARTPLPADVALRGAPRHLREEARSLAPRRKRRRRSTTRSRELYENEIKDVDSAIETYVQVLEDEPMDARRSPRSTSSTGGSGAGSLTSMSCAGASSSTSARRAHRPQVPARAHAREAPRATPPARSRTTARSSSSSRPHEGARGALEAMLEGDLAPRPRRSSSRSTRSAATGRSSSARWRSSARPRRTSRSGSRSSARRRASAPSG